MQPKDARKLLEKYRLGACSPEEKALVEYWFHHLHTDETHHFSDAELEQVHEDMWHQIRPPARIMPVRTVYKRVAVAVFALFMLSVSGYFLLKKPEVTQPMAKNVGHDISPGGNKAILTLANGGQIVLTDAKKGNIATEDQMLINKTADGQVIYINKGANTSSGYNTVSTPRGGQYSLTLSDGTKISLNAASSIKYPVAFTGADRSVELTGEAFFEVADNAAKPFKVISEGQIVEVLGTHFNINSYLDGQGIKTTLVTGSIRVSADTHTLLLSPGQQAQTALDAAGARKLLLNKNTDIQAAIAWKNDLFQFKNASIPEVMKDAVRWYDVEVIYEDDLPDIRVTGQISRKVNLSGLLELMKFAGAGVKLEGRTITISK